MCWLVTPIACFTATAFLSMGCPSNITVPVSGINKPVIMRISVVFPAPFGPKSPRKVPSFISMDTPSTAVTVPNFL